MAKIAIAVLAVVGGICLLMAVGACLLGAYWSVIGGDASPAIGAAFLCLVPGVIASAAAVLFGQELR